MYLEHFKLQELPFGLTPNTGYYCDLAGHQSVFNELLVSLRSGEGFIKVIGEVGSGKTLMCRKLLNALGAGFVTAYIPNPNLTVAGLNRALAHELGVDLTRAQHDHQLRELITNKLLQFHENNKHVVLLIDEAQVLSEECLEAIRLLTNLETESVKLLQVVLFGQPELDQKLQQSSLRQLAQRITFSCLLQPLKRKDMESYIAYRLAKAGYRYGNLFTRSACDLLYRQTHGVPRLINILCHKAMLVAYGLGESTIDKRCVWRAIYDTESLKPWRVRVVKASWLVALIALLGVSGLLWQYSHTLTTTTSPSHGEEVQ